MEGPKISVIIPVYNVEKYLPACLDSVIRQSYTSLELILVDDGSSDRSLEICRSYAERITVGPALQETQDLTMLPANMSASLILTTSFFPMRWRNCIRWCCVRRPHLRSEAFLSGIKIGCGRSHRSAGALPLKRKRQFVWLSRGKNQPLYVRKAVSKTAFRETSFYPRHHI